MQEELAASQKLGRDPDFSILRVKAAEISSEAFSEVIEKTANLASRCDERIQIESLGSMLKTIDSLAQSFLSQISAIDFSAFTASFSDLKSALLSLSSTSDRAALLESILGSFGSISGNLPPEAAARMFAILNELADISSRASVALGQLTLAQLDRCAVLTEARHALNLLKKILPEDSATYQLVHEASDHLVALDKAADADIESVRSQPVFLRAGSANSSPVAGLGSIRQQLLSLHDKASASASKHWRSLALTVSALGAPSVAFAYTSNPPLISGLKPRVEITRAGNGAESMIAPSSEVASHTATYPDGLTFQTPAGPASNSDSAAVSNQAAFASQPDNALSPLVQALVMHGSFQDSFQNSFQNSLRHNPTLSQNWEDQQNARGFYIAAFSPGVSPSETPLGTALNTRPRKFSISTDVSPPDSLLGTVMRRLVYQDFAGPQLGKMSQSRRAGNMLSVFADGNQALSRGLGVSSSGLSIQNAMRIPQGLQSLSRLVAREMAARGLEGSSDMNGASFSNSNTPNDPASTSTVIPQNFSASLNNSGGSMPLSLAAAGLSAQTKSARSRNLSV
jgi:hypothetical protein